MRAFVLPGQEVFSKGDFTFREEVKTWPVLCQVDYSTGHLKVRVCSISHVQFHFVSRHENNAKGIKSYLEKVVNNYGSCPPIFWMRVTEQSKCSPWVWIVCCSYYEFNFIWSPFLNILKPLDWCRPLRWKSQEECVFLLININFVFFCDYLKDFDKCFQEILLNKVEVFRWLVVFIAILPKFYSLATHLYTPQYFIHFFCNLSLIEQIPIKECPWCLQGSGAEGRWWWYKGHTPL